jgi:NhaP-type Na+/H+ and K+/H+ antiporter
MSSTDSASVFNLLRSQQMQLKHNLKPMLELESGSNDPMAYLLVIVLIQVIGAPESWSLGTIIRDLVVQFAAGIFVGYAVGKGSAWLINRINLSTQSMYSVLLLSLVFISFTLTELLHGNSYLAVYISGLVLGNEKLTNRKEMNTFMDGLTWLAQIVMFLSLGLLVNPLEILDVVLVALLLVVVAAEVELVEVLREVDVAVLVVVVTFGAVVVVLPVVALVLLDELDVASLFTVVLVAGVELVVVLREEEEPEVVVVTLEAAVLDTRREEDEDVGEETSFLTASAAFTAVRRVLSTCISLAFLTSELRRLKLSSG